MLALLVLLDLAVALPSTPTPAPPVPPRICNAPSFDLDGDGDLDDFQPVPETCGSGGCQFEVRRSGDERVLGTIAGCWFTLGSARSHGLFDLVAVWRLGTTHETTRLRFDGKHYRPRPAASGQPGR